MAKARPGNYATELEFVVSYDTVLVDLSKLTANYTAKDGDILTGKAPQNIGVSIPAGATVTLSDADITSIDNDEDASHPYAGITCSGNVTLILSGDNKVKGGYEDYPGIFAATNATLTIKGNGKLTAESNGRGAGIGGGFQINCGNIVIEGGEITATGGGAAAGIGSSYMASCGNITINGGTITAMGGKNAAGIGSGYNASCGDITIANTVTSVTATKGENAPNSIGAGGKDSTCGTVTIAPGANVTQN